MTSAISTDAAQIRKLIREAEALSDELLVACSRLKQAMVLARQHPEITVATGQRALVRLSDAESQALSVSSNLFRIHAELNKIGVEQAGLDDGDKTDLAPMVAHQAMEPEMA
jgi:hypothetical protein